MPHQPPSIAGLGSSQSWPLGEDLSSRSGEAAPGERRGSGSHVEVETSTASDLTSPSKLRSSPHHLSACLTSHYEARLTPSSSHCHRLTSEDGRTASSSSQSWGRETDSDIVRLHCWDLRRDF